MQEKIREQLENFDEKEIDRTEAIISFYDACWRWLGFECFTQGEDSQRFRYDCCSNKCFCQRFEQAKTMMSAMSKGKGMPNMGSFAPMGMGSLPGMGKSLKAKTALLKIKKLRLRKVVPGNPAKRAQQERSDKQNNFEQSTGLIKYGTQLSLPLMIFLKTLNVCLENMMIIGI